MRRYTQSRKDENQATIVPDLERLGMLVLDTSSCGDAVPDLFIYYRRKDKWTPMEIKMPGGTFTPAQIRAHTLWRILHGVDIPCATSSEEAIKILEAL